MPPRSSTVRRGGRREATEGAGVAGGTVGATFQPAVAVAGCAAVSVARAAADCAEPGAKSASRSAVGVARALDDVGEVLLALVVVLAPGAGANATVAARRERFGCRLSADDKATGSAKRTRRTMWRYKGMPVT